jgi:pilus assembly protein Flp/PilA
LGGDYRSGLSRPDLSSPRRLQRSSKGVKPNMLIALMTVLQSLTARLSLRDEDGQALVEYGLLVALIAVVCVVVIGLLGNQISTAFQNIVNAL